jgi:hypothetical protein
VRACLNMCTTIYSKFLVDAGQEHENKLLASRGERPATPPVIHHCHSFSQRDTACNRAKRVQFEVDRWRQNTRHTDTPEPKRRGLVESLSPGFCRFFLRCLGPLSPNQGGPHILSTLTFGGAPSWCTQTPCECR